MMRTLLATGARLLCGCHARWAGPPPAPGACIYYANHTSHLDALLIWAALPDECRRRCRMVAAADYWEATKLRRWLAHDVFRAVLIDRHEVTRSHNPLDAMLTALDAADALIIFPEGTRGAGDELGEFRTGLWHVARKRPAVPFVPVWLENLSRVLPKGEFLPVPLITAATFGAPLHFCPDQSRDEFVALLRTTLATLRAVHP